jgi:hypothetical protein
MTNETERYFTAFHDRARVIAFSLFNDFKAASLHVDPQQRNNDYQQLQGRYVFRLKLELHRVAGEILGETSPLEDTEAANRLIRQYIEEYKKEFVRKVRSL